MKSKEKAITGNHVADGDDPMSLALVMQARAMERSAHFAIDWMDFIGARMQQDFAAMQALGRCGSIEETFATLGDFQKKALEDYTVAAARLSMETALTTDELSDDIAEETAAVARTASQLAA